MEGAAAMRRMARTATGGLAARVAERARCEEVVLRCAPLGCSCHVGDRLAADRPGEADKGYGV